MSTGQEADLPGVARVWAGLAMKPVASLGSERMQRQREVAAFSVRAGLAALALSCALPLGARAQASSRVNIPLRLVPSSGGPGRNGTTVYGPYQLGINIGINGGASQRYLFDTGSALLNANYLGSKVPGSPFGAAGN